MATLYKRGRTYYSILRIRGKRIRKALSTERRVAESKLADLIKQRDGPAAGEKLKITWPAFKERYLAYSVGSKNGTTPKRDAAAISALENFELPFSLESITPEYLERFMAYRKAQKKGVATIQRDIGAIKAMLRKAVSWRYMHQQDWRSVKRPKSTRGRLLFYSVPELRTLIAECRSASEGGHDWLTICLLGAQAGLRRSEIYWLTWKDLDQARKLISITPKAGWNPKDFEQRHVPIAAELGVRLKEIAHVDEYVVANHPAPDVMSSYFRRILRRIGLAGSLHTLRHTFASHLVQAGVPLYDIAKLLGHSNTRTTEIYAHLAPQSFEAAIKRLPKL